MVNKMKLNWNDIALINKAILQEKKALKVDFPKINSVNQLETMTKDDLLFICSSLTNNLTKEDNYYADDLISIVLVFLEKRGDMKEK